MQIFCKQWHHFWSQRTNWIKHYLSGINENWNLRTSSIISTVSASKWVYFQSSWWWMKIQKKEKSAYHLNQRMNGKLFKSNWLGIQNKNCSVCFESVCRIRLGVIWDTCASLSVTNQQVANCFLQIIAITSLTGK